MTEKVHFRIKWYSRKKKDNNNTHMHMYIIGHYNPSIKIVN